MKHIVIITNPMIAANRSAEVTLSKFLRVVRPSVGSIQVIGGNLSVEDDLNDIVLTSFPIIRQSGRIKRIASVAAIQFKMMASVIRNGKIDQPIYFWIADKMILPYLAAKAKKMEVNYFIYGNVEKEGRKSTFTALSGRLIRYMASHADYVCMESASVKKEWHSFEGKRYKLMHLYTDVVTSPAFVNRANVLGMVCRLTPGKHVLESITALHRLHEKHPDWRLEIIGSGKQQQECEDLIKQLDAESYIDLVGWVEHSELQSHTKSWKYLLFPSDTEGLPNGLIEMMGYGIPAIASAVGGIADVVQDGKNGILLSECSIDAISAGIERAILMPRAAYQEMAENAYQTILDEFTLSAAQKTASKYL